ncbi:MAG: HAMP domain-containing protein [Acidobacteria bacterium]|nr:HAMP domain-containing protein [Acidobacteriota bacterium]
MTLAPPAAVDIDQPSGRTRRRIGMRWKLLAAFGLGFTVIFVVLAYWILQFSTDTATNKLKSTLREISEGGAQTIDVAAFEQLLTADPTVQVGSVYPEDAGTLAGTTATADSVYPTDPAYWAHVQELANIRITNPEASPYTYAQLPDGTVAFVGSWGARGYPVMGSDPPNGGQFLQDVLDWVDQPTKGYFMQGFTETTEQPAYSDALSSWISVYTPIRNDAGKVVGAIGVDYDLRYVDQVRARVLRVLYPVFAVAYLILMAMVFWLSGWLTQRLGRLSSATRRVADGDYQVDLSATARAAFPDEMSELADAFLVMVEKVGTRERTLVQQVQVLKVEIDENKRRQAVVEIVESDFFSDLTAKAGAMRRKVKALDEDGDGA